MKKDELKPYIPASEKPKELTIPAIITGSILAIIFGTANAYLGLRVGMTIAASIPATVISMTILRLILHRNSILENNIVQSIGSTGEALAAGIVFTVPAFFLWAREDVCEKPVSLQMTILAIVGGVCGVIFMIPFRRYLVKDEHKTLPFPEGTACAKVLLAGEEGAKGGGVIAIGIGVSVLIKLLIDGFCIAATKVTIPVKKLFTQLSFEPYPALIGVGYICGLKVSASLFAGGMLSWFVIIPLIMTFGGDTVIAPCNQTVAQVFETQGVHGIWSNYIRYIGTGAVAMAGLISLAKSLPVIATSFIHAIKGLKKGGNATADRTDQDMNLKSSAIWIAFAMILLFFLPQIKINWLGIILFFICGFFFSTVAARIVGVIGSSNSPSSGMTIATLLITATILRNSGYGGVPGMLLAMTIASMICVVVAISADTSQDLKTGFLLGATPKKQQIGMIISVLCTALVIGGIVWLLDNAWGFGSEKLPAPQANLMKIVAEGVMRGTMPWTLLFIGAGIAVVFELFGIHSLSPSVGVFLPIGATSTILLGGLIKHLTSLNKKSSEERGILFCSGLIAGEGITGVILAGLTVFHLNQHIDFSNCKWLNSGEIGGIVAGIITMVLIWVFSKSDKQATLKK